VPQVPYDSRAVLLPMFIVRFPVPEKVDVFHKFGAKNRLDITVPQLREALGDHLTMVRGSAEAFLDAINIKCA
jgi:hypothetical protein